MSNKRKFALDENREVARIYVNENHEIDGPFLDLLSGPYYSVTAKKERVDDEAVAIYVSETHVIDGPFLDRLGKSYYVLAAKNEKQG